MPDTVIDNNNRCSGPNGFTFLEVMIALSMLAIVLLGVYRLQAQTAMMNARSRFDTIAPLLAQHKLGETEISLADAVGESGDFGDDYPGYTWEVLVSEVTSEILGQVAEDMVQIDVVITNEALGTYNLRTYRLITAE